MSKVLTSLIRAQRGDTIVEVMIVLAVLGSAISISYATANRSLLNARQAQENSEATELIQSQIEAIRVIAPEGKNAPDPKNVFRPAGFCIDIAGGNFVIQNTTSASPKPECHENEFYDILVLYCGVANTDPLCAGLTGTNTDTFVVQAKWDNVRGLGKDTVKLTHRIHEP